MIAEAASPPAARNSTRRPYVRALAGSSSHVSRKCRGEQDGDRHDEQLRERSYTTPEDRGKHDRASSHAVLRFLRHPVWHKIGAILKRVR